LPFPGELTWAPDCELDNRRDLASLRCRHSYRDLQQQRKCGRHRRIRDQFTSQIVADGKVYIGTVHDPLGGPNPRANWISTVRRLNEAFQSSSRTTPIIRPEHRVMDDSLNLYFADSNCCRSVSTCSLCPCGPTLRYTFLITPLGSIKKVLRAARVIPLYSMIEPYFSTTV
jgi:hypothetical protein